MTNETVVNSPLTTEQAEKANTEPIVTEELSEPHQAKAGDKTPPNELLGALQEERERRRKSEATQKELEETIERLKNSSISSEDEVFSDEGKTLQKQIKALESQLTETKRENAKKDLLIANPILKEHLKEFEEFQIDPENKGMNLRTAAKAFMVEKGLLDTPRIGLEKPTGGSKQPSTLGKMSSADAELLRKTNFKKYMDMVVKDQIHIED